MKSNKLIIKKYKGSNKHKYIIFVLRNGIEKNRFIITNKIKEPKKELIENEEIFDYIKVY